MDFKFQLTGKYDESQSIRDILRVRDILSLDRCVTAQLLTNHSDTDKNRVQVVLNQLFVIWAKSHVIANKQSISLSVLNKSLCLFVDLSNQQEKILLGSFQILIDQITQRVLVKYYIYTSYIYTNSGVC